MSAAARWWREPVHGVVAAAVAVAAMAAVAVAGVGLAGGGRYGDPAALAAAVVVLAAGGGVELTLSVPAAVPLTAVGGLTLRPLGVSLAGAVGFGAVLLLPLRPRPVTVSQFAARVAGGVAGFAGLLGVVSRLATGEAVLPGAGDAPELVVGYAVGPVRALVGALAWALLVAGLGWLGSARAPVPAGWRRWRARLAPAASAVFAVTVAAAGLTVAVAAVVAAGPAADGPRLLGGALLLGPVVPVVLVTVGGGGRWAVVVDGLLAEPLRARLGELGEPGAGLGLGRLAAEAGAAGWLVPVAAATLFFAGCGVLVAARTSAAGPRRAVAAVRAGLLAGVLAVAVPGAVAVAGGGVELALPPAGAGVPLMRAELTGGLLSAAGLGAGGGAVAGFLSSLIVRRSYGRSDE